MSSRNLSLPVPDADVIILSAPSTPTLHEWGKGSEFHHKSFLSQTRDLTVCPSKNAELQKENRELRRQLAARSKDALQTTTAAHTLQQLRAPFDPPRLSINAPASNDQSLEEITVSGESLANIYEL